MTKEIDTASPEDQVEYLMNEMTEGRFRHVPIIDGDEIVGIVSIGDVVKALLDHTKRQVSQLEDYIAEPRVDRGSSGRNE
jgi:CBS domain-containing protein